MFSVYNIKFIVDGFVWNHVEQFYVRMDFTYVLYIETLLLTLM